MAHFSVLPPEINSLRMYLGAGSAPVKLKRCCSGIRTWRRRQSSGCPTMI